MAIANQRLARRRARLEVAIGLLAPALDLLLLVGERVSAVLDRDDPDYVLARMAPEEDSPPRGLRDQP